MNKKDLIFRSINAIGFAANAASICVPHHSAAQDFLKKTSFFCNAAAHMTALYASDIFHPRRPFVFKNFALGFVCDMASLADAFSMGNHPHFPHARTTQENLYDSCSMAIQLLNVFHGLDKKTSPRL